MSKTPWEMNIAKDTADPEVTSLRSKHKLLHQFWSKFGFGNENIDYEYQRQDQVLVGWLPPRLSHTQPASRTDTPEIISLFILDNISSFFSQCFMSLNCLKPECIEIGNFPSGCLHPHSLCGLLLSYPVYHKEQGEGGGDDDKEDCQAMQNACHQPPE